jgi:phosphatidylglycerophosphate synthase
MSVAADQLTPREIRERYNGGGYWWTFEISQRIAAAMAPRAIRSGIAPNRISLLNLVVGLATSGAVIALHDGAAVVAMVVALVGWQLAYGLDCLDGQVARATGRTSPHGAVLDLVCDFIVQLGVITAAVVAGAPAMSDALAAILAGAWLSQPYFKGAAGSLDDSDKRDRERSPVEVIRHLRDYGLHIAAVAVAIAISADAVLVVLCVIGALNAIFYLRTIVSYARR